VAQSGLAGPRPRPRLARPGPAPPARPRFIRPSKPPSFDGRYGDFGARRQGAGTTGREIRVQAQDVYAPQQIRPRRPPKRRRHWVGSEVILHYSAPAVILLFVLIGGGAVTGRLLVAARVPRSLRAPIRSRDSRQRCQEAL